MREKQLYGRQIYMRMKDGRSSKLFYNLSRSPDESLADWKRIIAVADKNISYAVYQEVWLDQNNVESYHDLDYYNL